MDRTTPTAEQARPPVAGFRPTEAVWLALLPLLGAYFAFLFKAGFYSFYGIPSTLVELDTNAVVMAASSLFFALAYWGYPIYLWTHLLKIEGVVFKALCKSVILFLFISPWLALAGPPSSKVWIWLGCASILPTACPLISWLLGKFEMTIRMKRKIVLLKRRILSKPRQIDKTETSSLPLYFIGTLLALTLLAIPSGRFLASQRIGYWADQADPSSLLIGTKGETAILITLTDSSNAISGRIKLVPMSDLKLMSVQTGRLKEWEPLQPRKAD